jgi:hypothetical protein
MSLASGLWTRLFVLRGHNGRKLLLFVLWDVPRSSTLRIRKRLSSATSRRKKGNGLCFRYYLSRDTAGLETLCVHELAVPKDDALPLFIERETGSRAMVISRVL